MSSSDPPPGRPSGHTRRPDPRLASGKPPRSGRDLVGRDGELGRLQELLDRARDGSPGALVLTGDAGIGKTSLLDAAEARAEGFVRLRARGVESESAIGHGVLVELLAPVRDLLADLPAPQADALAAAAGWGPASTSAPGHLVGAATLTILAAAAAAAPVLVVVDDLHWADRESAAAVLFAARRLRHDPVAFLLATRSGLPTTVPLDGLEAVSLGGLTATAVARLLEGRVTAGVVPRLAEQTRGNPLALL